MFTWNKTHINQEISLVTSVEGWDLIVIISLYHIIRTGHWPKKADSPTDPTAHETDSPRDHEDSTSLREPT